MLERKSDLLLVVNPRAGGHSRRYAKDVLPNVMQLGQAHGEVISAPTIQSFRDLFARALEARPKVLAIFGGDGTIYHVLNVLFELTGARDLPLILPLKGGTMNNLSRDASMAGRADHVFEHLITSLKNGRPLMTRKRGVMRCEVNPGGKVYYGFVFANGISYEGIKDYYARNLSAVGAARLIFEMSFHPGTQARIAGRHWMRLGVDGKKWPEDHYLGTLASTLDTIILGFRPFPEVIADPARQISFIGTTYTARQIVPRLPAVFFNKLGGKFLNASRYFNVQGERIILETRHGFTLDGELMHHDEPNEVALSVGPVIEIPRV